ncbi:MAG TPA: UvrD-helicase domain-containing protein, partial [Acidimicrobiales bacterium]
HAEVVPVDAEARRRITETELDRTLFVEAGAGTGKTSALVERIVNLVTRDGVDMRSIAAITFTEAAAAELRHRVRVELERASEQDAASRAERARVALGHVDSAAISTLHSFAQRLLSEHPVEVGIPPKVEVLDEVQSSLAFEARWSDALDRWLHTPELEELITRTTLLKLDIVSTTRASLRDVAAILDDNWDRLELWAASGELPDEPPPLPPIDVGPLHDAIRAVLDLPAECTNDDDLLLQHVLAIRGELQMILGTDEPFHVLRLLADRSTWARKNGRRTNWVDVDRARDVLARADQVAKALRERAIDDVLDRWLHLLAHFTLDAAHQRTASGRLEFHDLLVLARRLLRTSPEARNALARRYTHLLLDEFQDTDPIQIELAVLLAARDQDGPRRDWDATPVREGSLFFVGDPKQSIYRFRRADIALFLKARDCFAGAEPVRLVQNFRTVSPVVDWVNAVFGALMPQELPGVQPKYEPIKAARAGHPDVDHRVALLGGPHDDDPDATELRRREAADVTACILDIAQHPERWLVERDGEWVPPRFADITILLPTRTSLPILEDALNDAGIPYRADTSSLVFDTTELRELLVALRAVDDPGDAIAVVATCRSPLFGCADSDLYEFHVAGGSWDYRRPVPESLSDDHPVVVAMTTLARWHRERLWSEPAELLQRILRDRAVFAVALSSRRPRDTWRRIRFLVDQARRFSEAGGGDLRAFVQWADLQRHESARVAEPLLPETDDDAVRIMTFHGAKGLEFPITILSGLTTAVGGRRSGPQVLWDERGAPKIRLKSNVTSAHFDVLADLEQEMDIHEKWRLLYVGATRARDHLIVSAHHKPDKDTHASVVWRHSQPVLGDVCRVFEPQAVPVPEPEPVPAPVPTPAAAPAVDADDFDERRAAMLRSAGRRKVWSATAIAKAMADARGEVVDDGALEAGADDDELDAAAPAATSIRRGRGGTAFGRAVHAVLQHATPATTDEQLQARAHAAAVDEGIASHAADVARAARAALESPAVRQAHGATRVWHELFVAAPVHDGVVLEGFVDLVADTPDGLVVIDYKTDRVEPDGIDRALATYRPQAAAYALALERATDRPVASCTFVFAQPDGAIERQVDDLPAAVADVRAFLAAS